MVAIILGIFCLIDILICAVMWRMIKKFDKDTMYFIKIMNKK